MFDITKCLGTDCPHKESCRRYTFTLNDYQSYFSEPPVKDGKCDYYWGENAESIWTELKEIVKQKDE